MVCSCLDGNNYGDKTMKALGPSIWNSIPDQVLKSASYNSFKTSLKKHLIGQYGNDNSDKDMMLLVAPLPSPQAHPPTCQSQQVRRGGNGAAKYNPKTAGLQNGVCAQWRI